VVPVANPVKQAVAWSVEMLNQIVANWEAVSTGIAIAVGLYLLWTLYQRVFLTDADPSLGYTVESDAGTASVLLSGVKVTLVLTTVIAVLTWPLVLESTPVLIALALANIVHYIVERREVDVT
jgi:hypothetical protein